MTEEKPKKEKDKQKKKNEIEQLNQEKQELFEKFQRLSADYANFQKRAPKQLADSLAYEKDKLVKALLPVMDNFEHTMKNADKAENTEILATAIRIVYDQMLAALKSIGTEQINAAGQKFDPSMHQAMLRQTDPDKEEDIVLEEFQVGYKLDGRVIRPSKVVVNKLPEKPQPEAPEQPEIQTEETETSETSQEEQ